MWTCCSASGVDDMLALLRLQLELRLRRLYVTVCQSFLISQEILVLSLFTEGSELLPELWAEVTASLGLVPEAFEHDSLLAAFVLEVEAS